MFLIGVILFALGIAISIALHECGHMWAAQATGMRVRRYFVGFGPKIFSFRRGHTEYGLKAIPLGGFCDIAGMTALDELTPEEEPQAMYKQATWKRMLVMFAGIGMNIVLGFVLVVILAVGWGLPDLRANTWVEVGELTCVAPFQNDDGSLASCTGAGPAELAGMKAGDRIIAVNGEETKTTEDVVAETRGVEGVANFTVRRGDQEMMIPVHVEQVPRKFKNGRTGNFTVRTVGAVGIKLEGKNDAHPIEKYSLLPAIPASVGFTGDLFVKTGEALLEMPSKVSSLWDAVTGGERRSDTPISVLGASEIGGQAAEQGLWQMFIGLLASLNFFLAVFNLLPLLPLDGGHIAVVGYEKARDWFRARRGLAPGGPFDYLKLLPVTYAVIVLGGAYMLLTLAADILNPIQW
ncbi:M50 family metallopeptidase [Smaragdicoccus niigatensis]|uniref:M50 family metallopeptidase n=1 Tax=Smaragdicoccus niigatensis TaxID=359359 RepID=UPI00037DE983|nr:site-2 protease family protein [Smaragdicoccus niigatensis]